MSQPNALVSWIKERRRMIGGVDNLFVGLEQSGLLNPVCAASCTFKGKMKKDMMVSWSNFQQTRFPKYKQRLCNTGRYFHGPTWEDDPTFKTENHISVLQLPGKAGKKEFEDAVGEFVARDWDYSRPLWDTIVFDNYHDDEGAESALITRGHHSLADGQGFVISQLYCTSFREELINTMDDGARRLHEAKMGTAKPSSLHPAFKPLDPAQKIPLLRPFVTIFLFLFYHAYVRVKRVASLLWSLYMLIHGGILFFLTFWRIVTITSDQKGSRATKREFATSKALAMSDIKLVQKAFSSRAQHFTVNDVMVACMADVLSQVVENRRKERTGVMRILDGWLPNRISFFIPISLREPGDWAMRNLSTGAVAYVPESHYSSNSYSEIRSHLKATKAELNILKEASLPSYAFSLAQQTGQAPIFFPTTLGLQSSSTVVQNITKAIANVILGSFQAILTNVPGPASQPVTFEGVEVIRWTASPPQGGKGTLGIGVISYAGSMCISISCDKVPGDEGTARMICEKFERRFQDYLLHAQKKE